MRPNVRTTPGKELKFEAEEGDALFVRSAARAMQVLAAFHGVNKALSLSEIAKLSGLDRSATQRIVHTLAKLDYVRRSSDDRGYLPGLRLLDHTLDVLRLDPLVQKATPVLLELRRSLRERIDLSLFDDTRMIYAFRIQSKRETFYATLVGHSVPAFATAGGRAALSLMTDDEVREVLGRSELIEYTAATRTDPEEILEQVRIARTNGYAVIVDEYLRGEVAIGVGISRDGRPIGAIHVAGSLSEWSQDDFERQAAPVAMEAARDIMASL
ncbi:MAG: IclR family transcriptional regulator [Phaeobacter gallaeciensis]